jgi:hypothetical protein
MEIKIYTQATPQKSIRESIDKFAVVLDLDPEDKAVAIAERTMNDVVHSNDEQSNLESNVLEKEVKYKYRRCMICCFADFVNMYRVSQKKRNVNSTGCRAS